MKFKFGLSIAIFCIASTLAVVPGSALAIDYANLYASVSPSVVTVKTGKLKISKTGIAMSPGVGTGFLLEPDLVLTAAHVVEDVDLIRVRFNDESLVDAKLVATVKTSDVALLKLKTPRADAVLAKIGDSDASQIGSPVFIVGAPYGIEQTLSVGFLSGRMTRGKTPQGAPAEFLQTDTAINPGNSGGPMFNAQGEVIGVVSFILTKSGGFDGIGFASAIKSAYQSLRDSTEYVAGFKGLKLSKRQSRALSIPGEGVLIQRVVEGSSADQLGLKAGTIPASIAEQDLLLGGDVILSVDCAECDEASESLAVDDIALKLSMSQSLKITIFREGQVVTLYRNTETETTPMADAALAELSVLSEVLTH